MSHRRLSIGVALWLAMVSPSPSLTGTEQTAARASESRVPVGGASLYVRDIGLGRPLIVLHGGPDFDQGYLLPELDQLADGYRLIYYDQRGRGKSADNVRPEDVTLASDVDDLDKVRQHVKLDAPVLLGHSWGSVLALEFALRHPRLVSHLVLMNPAPASATQVAALRRSYLAQLGSDMDRQRAITAGAAYKEGDPDAVAARYRIHFKHALQRPADYEKLMARMSAGFRSQGKAGILKAWAIEDRLYRDTWQAPGYDLLPRLRALRIPTLVIVGEHDFIPPAIATEIAHALPDATLITIPGCGHFAYLECGPAVRKALNDFFSRRVLASQPQTPREPASRAAVVLTWNQAQREAGFAGMETIFLTRTVRAGDHPHPLPDGRPLAFAPGGHRAGELDRFVTDQKVSGLLVLHDGAIRLERYALTGGRSVRWHSFSIAKSITSTLVGAAMKDGAIKSLDDPDTRYITDLRGSVYDEVTVRQLLTMTSGVRWNEDYTDLKSDVARMYAEPPPPGMDMTVSYVRKLPREAPPGSKWVYKTSETNLVGVLVMAATGKPLADYLSEKIWRPYGMERDAEWMLDDIGHEQGGCCLAMTLRDLGRFGLFILDGARIGHASVVPDSWLAEATRAQVSTGGGGSGYGYQWWARPDGAFEGRGIYGQTLHIDPKRRLVIAINSATEQPTGRPQGQARQDFIAAVKAELDREQR